ncbi:AbrB family transcriptional regulator [Roseicitreum antarcticum]|uniref:Ammonia monooxygenase n=1 Tax=Roseicitreum antarcticum TaxID=564137 RepID=A0A1H2ZBJ9_9RHOB|nr:AbrB family transcriptional regulator [Roseicitreum antarcticum]SDX14715.1 hypothetical protein SAMN04488238_105318 [Roseicitreum antarcticum]
MTKTSTQAGGRLARIALALTLGACGGVVFNWLGMPLPWMLGALVFNTIAAIAGAPVRAPTAARNYVVVVIGVMLGSGFTSDILAHVGGWVLSLMFLTAYMFIAGLLVVPYYIRLGKFDTASAYFSGMPGGLNEMISIGGDMGGDERKIALAHASRILITVSLLALWFRFIAGLEVGDRNAIGVPFTVIPPVELLVLAGCGVLGFFIGPRLRLPAPMLVGPMLISAVAHIAGLSTTPPPQELVMLAQLVLGTIMGCRFIGSTARQIGHAILLSIGATIITLAVTLVFAIFFHQLFGQTTEQVLLAFAPGGLAEMSLIALAMGAEVDYVALHHIVRITIIVVMAPLVFRLLRPWLAQPPRPDPDQDSSR